jgi:hypothetical protein
MRSGHVPSVSSLYPGKVEVTMADPLRNQLIRLAHARPDLRPHILPLVASAVGTESEATAGSDGYYMTAQYLRQIADQAGELAEAIPAGTPLPDWFEAKVAQAAGTVRDLHGYMKYKDE